MSEERRRAMGEAAVKAARAVGYEGAGTVEFIADSGAERFYFIEMNTRLQVEHPVTEAVTGLDLVEWQLRVAAGEPLPLRQEQIALSGCAIEVRLYAENPARGFLPATGTLHGLCLPDGAGVRVDTGVRPGDTVTAFYDPMIAKIVCRGADRETARLRLMRALADTAVLGVATNLGFLARTAADPEFAVGRVDTGFIERRRDTLLAPAGPPPAVALAAAALIGLLDASPGGAGDPADPWAQTSGWRVNLPAAARDFLFRCGGEEHAVAATAEDGGWRLAIDGRSHRASGELRPGGGVALSLDGVRRVVRVLRHAESFAVFAAGEGWFFDAVDPLAPPAGAETASGRLTAPMPGRVVQVLVGVGDMVRQGQPMIVVEAMKMEHTIAAPRDGAVAAVHFAPGDLVEEGSELIEMAEPGDGRAG
jgi:3-methylcrotonyl-CoA carboxylase alpha subunit